MLDKRPSADVRGMVTRRESFAFLPLAKIKVSLGQLFGKLQNIAMGRGTVLDYVRPEAQAVVDDLNELDNEEYEL